MHGNEGNYLAHTQGKRHQVNLAKRAARDAQDLQHGPVANLAHRKTKTQPRKTVKIGKPGYRVTKQYCRRTSRRSLLFQIDYPEIEEQIKPKHRFMSAFEQKVEPVNEGNKQYQYLLVAAEPYETIAFKVPNVEIDKSAEGSLIVHWEPDAKMFTLQIYLKKENRGVGGGGNTAYAGFAGRGGGDAAPPPPGGLPLGMPPMGMPPPPPMR